MFHFAATQMCLYVFLIQFPYPFKYNCGMQVFNNFNSHYDSVNIYTGSQHDYIVVQNCRGLAEIRGPYLHLHMAINELKKLAENCGNGWNKSNFLYLSEVSKYQKSESDTKFEFIRFKNSDKRQTKNWSRHRRPVTVDRSCGYCMMIIKITDGIIPNNCNGLSIIKKYGEEKWASVVIWDVIKMVEICQKNYSYMPF